MANRAPDPISRTSGGTPFKFGIEIVTQGFGAASIQETVRRLLTATARLGDPGPLVRTIARRIVFSIKRGILEQRSPEGASWPVLAQSTRTRPGRNAGGRALFDTGRLYEAVTYQERGPGEAAVGVFDVPYAKFHQEGTRAFNIWPRSSLKTRKAVVMRFWGGNGWIFSKKISHPGIPARPFIGVRSDDVPSIQQLAAAWAESAFDQQQRSA